MQFGRVGDLGGWVVGLPGMSRVLRPECGCNLVSWCLGGQSGWVDCYVQGGRRGPYVGGCNLVKWVTWAAGGGVLAQD